MRHAPCTLRDRREQKEMQTIFNFIAFLIVAVWLIGAPGAGAQQDRIRMEEKVGLTVIPAKLPCPCDCAKK
jgi:hypothetical protein